MKTALITGANKGIGFALAKVLGKKEWHIIIGARNEERAKAAVEKLQADGIQQVDSILIDLSDPATITQAINTSKQIFQNLIY
ncbi:MAG: SDR family NAD(P)-dependent oxidoreductase [Enterococcus sp.]